MKDFKDVTFIEYQQKKKKMMDDLGRTEGMCESVSCDKCPLNYRTDKGYTCPSIELLDPEKVVEIVMSYESEVDWNTNRRTMD